jgi:hypothetical protein
MTSIRIPFESYAAQVAQNYNSNSNFSQNGPSIAIDPTYDENNKSQFQFQPQITTFAINSVDEDEDPEEKMHSPRTPYGSVPDSIANNKKFKFNNNNTTTNTLYPPKLEIIQRTISASSFESTRSSSFEQDSSLGYAPTLSATSSITRCDLKPFYSSSSPETSPCHTPKAYKLSLNLRDRDRDHDHDHKMRMAMDDNDAVEEKCIYMEKNAREQNIEAIHKALMEVKTKKQNGFVLYKHGLATYSASNSGSNTAGTATPNSIGALSRSSSCGSVGSAETRSVCSFDDHAIDDHDLESLNLNEFVNNVSVSSGASTPVAVDMYQVVGVVSGGVMSEDEMETPVPATSDKLLSPEGEGDEGKSPFDFDIGRNGFGLAKISEDVEHETMVTPNTNLTECKTEINSYDLLEEDVSEDDEPLPSEQRDCVGDKCMELEDEIILKGSCFQSSRILFLDVDGVLLSTKEQATLGKGENIKFNDDVTSLMIKLCRETECDIVISSTWQFHTESHLPYLIAYLVACGWRRNKIHTLLDLLPNHANDGIDYGREWYEQSPYCRCRARGIQKIVQLYGNYITRWCCLDDLPLHSVKLVCIPNKEDIKYVVERVSCAYFKPFTWRQNESVQLMPEIKYAVKYALTSLPNCIFSTQSYRFGYEYNQTMIYYQADAIAKLCKLTYEIKDNSTYQLILQNMMAVMQQYISANLSYQGDPYIAPYLIQTDQNTGVTVENIENTITLLTYQTPHITYEVNDMNPNFNSV